MILYSFITSCGLLSVAGSTNQALSKSLCLAYILCRCSFQYDYWVKNWRHDTYMGRVPKRNENGGTTSSVIKFLSHCSRHA
jgi:hypothetical protein